MSDEIERKFSVSVRVTKDTPGNVEDDVNCERILKMVKDGIEESCGRTCGVINSYIIGDVKMNLMEEKNG